MSGFSESEVRAALDRVAASKGIKSSGRMIRLLRFVVEQALRGKSGELKEYVLGVSVFDRGPAFDPRVDPIVRVEVRRLRSKLKDYYAGEGSNENLIIEIPTGTYVPRFSSPGPEQPAAGGRHVERPSLAVLPFANLSPEPDTEYFSDGLTEELIHALTRIPGLRVVAWTSASQLRHAQEDLAEIGSRLKAESVLQGSIRQQSGRIRVLARLVAAESGQILWSETYDRSSEGVFAIQEEISQAIASSLKVKLLPPRTRVAPRRDWSLLVYNLYLRGRFLWNKRTTESLERAIRYFEEALAMEPDFAPGHAGIADSYALLGQFAARPAKEVMPLAKSAALRALELDPDLAEAHASMGFIESWFEWRWESARQHYRRAIEIHPGYATAHHWYGCDFLAMLGEFDEAVTEMDVAAGLDPLSVAITDSRAYVLFLAGRFEESLEGYGRALELDANFPRTLSGIGRVYLQSGRYQEAIQSLERARTIVGDAPMLLGALAQAQGMSGDAASARKLIQQMEKMSAERFVSSASLALAYTGLGETCQALDCLERGFEGHELALSSLYVHPAYDSLRQEPRFQALLSKIGFLSGNRQEPA